jgi:hypothetical protein
MQQLEGYGQRNPHSVPPPLAQRLLMDYLATLDLLDRVRGHDPDLPSRTLQLLRAPAFRELGQAFVRYFVEDLPSPAKRNGSRDRVWTRTHSASAIGRGVSPCSRLRMCSSSPARD